ncbi:MAG: hypothetical protein ACRC9L_02440 [Brevinema sp.]
MKKIAFCSVLVLLFAACGKKEKDPNQTNTGIPGYDTTLPSGRIVNRLKNTKWEIPAYKEAFIQFTPEGVNLGMNAQFVMSNARMTIVSEADDMLVFTVDDLTNSVVLSLKVKDKDTLSIAPHIGAGSEAVAQHETLAQEFKKAN